MARQRQPLLKLRNVSFSYEGAEDEKHTLFEDVGFSLYQGENLLIRGASGAGKSTLALICAGLLRPSMGKVSICRPANRDHPGNPIQMVFQDPYAAINPTRKISQWLRIAAGGGGVFRDMIASLRNIEHTELAIVETLELVNLPFSVLARYPSELSGGECQRANIAAALLAQPECLILDEPVSMLDRISRESIVNVIENVKKTFGMSIIEVCHEKSIFGFGFGHDVPIE